MGIAATQSVFVHREAVIGSEEVKRVVSLAELFQPFDDGLPLETSIEPTRQWSGPEWQASVVLPTLAQHAHVLNKPICTVSRRCLQRLNSAVETTTGLP